MLAHRLNKILRPETGYVRLAIGCIIVALAVAFGTVGGMALFGMELNAAIPTVLAAVAAASYVVFSAKK